METIALLVVNKNSSGTNLTAATTDDFVTFPAPEIGMDDGLGAESIPLSRTLEPRFRFLSKNPESKTDL